MKDYSEQLFLSWFGCLVIPIIVLLQVRTSVQCSVCPVIFFRDLDDAVIKFGFSEQNKVKDAQ